MTTAKTKQAQAALSYAKLGLKIFPAKAQGKSPVHTGWQSEATSDVAIINKWWATCSTYNIGFPTGQANGGVYDMECDIKDGVEGDLVLQEYAKTNYFTIPQTWAFKSGGGGIHRLFRCNTPMKNRAGFIKNVDFRGDGGLCILPGSLHQSGNYYEWLPGCSPKDLPEGPADIPFHLFSTLISHDQSGKGKVTLDEIIEEGQRNDKLFRIGSFLRQFGANDAEIHGFLTSTNELRCEDPLPDDELDRIVARSASYASGPRLSSIIECDESLLLNPVSISTLMKTDLPELRYVVKDLLIQGLNVVASPPKFGKSWWVLDLCLCVAAGRPFMGLETEQARCLYLALEDGPHRMKKRTAAVLGSRPAPEEFDYITRAVDLQHDLIGQLEEYVIKYPNTGLVVIDTLQKIRGTAGKMEMAYGYDYREMGLLKAFADKYGVCVLVVHHLRKMADDDVFNRISGTAGISGAADTMLVMSKESRGSEETVLSVVGRDVEYSENIIVFDKATCRWNLIGDADDRAEQRRQQEYENSLFVRFIRQAVAENPHGWSGTMQEVIEGCGARFGEYPPETSPQAATKAIQKVVPMLLQYDHIGHQSPSPNGGRGGRKHTFYNMAKGPIRVADKKADNDDVPFKTDVSTSSETCGNAPIDLDALLG